MKIAAAVEDERCLARNTQRTPLTVLPRVSLGAAPRSGLTLRCSRLATAGFASLRERLSSNVRPTRTREAAFRFEPPPRSTHCCIRVVWVQATVVARGSPSFRHRAAWRRCYRWRAHTPTPRRAGSLTVFEPLCKRGPTRRAAPRRKALVVRRTEPRSGRCSSGPAVALCANAHRSGFWQSPFGSA